MGSPRVTHPNWGGASKSNMVQITDGTNEADIIAIIHSLKTDLSSIAGEVTSVDAGDADAGTQRVTLATDDVAIAAVITAIGTVVTAIETASAYVGIIGSAHGTGVAVIGGKAESTVPTEVADGEAVAVWLDTFGRLVQLATDVAQNALSVSDIAPAQMQVAKWLDWAALTAPDDETPEANVQDYENHTIQYTIATIDTSVDLVIWGSIDGGVSWFPMSRFTVLAADEQIDTVIFSGVKVERIKCEFDGEVGGVAAVVTFALMSGN